MNHFPLQFAKQNQRKNIPLALIILVAEVYILENIILNAHKIVQNFVDKLLPHIKELSEQNVLIIFD